MSLSLRDVLRIGFWTTRVVIVLAVAVIAHHITTGNWIVIISSSVITALAHSCWYFVVYHHLTMPKFVSWVDSGDGFRVTNFKTATHLVLSHLPVICSSFYVSCIFFFAQSPYLGVVSGFLVIPFILMYSIHRLSAIRIQYDGVDRYILRGQYLKWLPDVKMV